MDIKKIIGAIIAAALVAGVGFLGAKGIKVDLPCPAAQVEQK